MPKIMKRSAISAVALTAVFTALYRAYGVSISFAITFGTIAYHFCMRLLVGEVYDRTLHNRVNYDRKWFQVSKKEKQLYKLLKVKSWKASMPTYDPTLFDPKQHTWDEIAQAMCQSELVHETNVALSFLPILGAIWFGSLPVFIITSVLAACYDAMFVIIQRYNRPRILKLTSKHK